MVGVKRLELPAPWSQTTCATKLRYTPSNHYQPSLLTTFTIYYMLNLLSTVFLHFFYFISKIFKSHKLTTHNDSIQPNGDRVYVKSQPYSTQITKNRFL